MLFLEQVIELLCDLLDIERGTYFRDGFSDVGFILQTECNSLNLLNEGVTGLPLVEQAVPDKQKAFLPPALPIARPERSWRGHGR